MKSLHVIWDVRVSGYSNLAIINLFSVMGNEEKLKMYIRHSIIVQKKPNEVTLL